MSLGQQKAELHRLVDALPEEKIGSARKLLELMLSGNKGFAPCAYDGKGFHFWALAAPIYDDRGNLLGAVQRIRDIGERKKMEEELRFWSTRDALTGLYNRAFFEEELRRLEKSCSFPISLILCDLDGLKVVNDMLGHEQRG